MTEAQDLSHFVRRPAEGVAAMDLVVDGVYCGACIVTIEKGLVRQAGVRGARVNLASKRVTVEWNEGALDPPVILERLEALGYPAYPFAAETVDSVEIEAERRLLRCLGRGGLRRHERHAAVDLAVGGGRQGPEFGDPRSLPLAVGSRRPPHGGLRRPAVLRERGEGACARGRSIWTCRSRSASCSRSRMSMLQTLAHERVAYFDSALMLLMFLLAGRYLDQRMRRRTRDFAVNLSAIRADRAIKLFEDGEARETPIAAIRPGDIVLVRAGERIAVDGTVEDGRSEIDQSLVTGETAPIAVSPGAEVYAGTLNLTGALRVRVRSAASGTLLDEVNGLLERAVEQRSSYVRLADRAARLYVPVVHVTALATFLGWLALGAGWQQALLVAITVLIITCPCALGLAVPAVQAVAAGALFRHGLILNSGEALERLAEADTVVFDKTGTLDPAAPDARQRRRHRAGGSRARRRASAREQAPARQGDRRGGGRERADRRRGILRARASARCGRAKALRLGSVAWCGAEAEAAPVAAAWPDASLIALRRAERAVVFAVRQGLRPDARAAVADIARAHAVEILSGDREPAVALVARELGVARFEAGLKPADKISRLKALAEAGRAPADGRRRPQRRARARRRPRLDFADLRRLHRPGAGRRRLPRRAAHAGRRRLADRGQGAAVDGRESMAVGDLQSWLPCRSPCSAS